MNTVLEELDQEVDGTSINPPIPIIGPGVFSKNVPLSPFAYDATALAYTQFPVFDIATDKAVTTYTVTFIDDPNPIAGLDLAKLEAIDVGLAHKLRELMMIDQDWDGFGGQPAALAAVNEAARLLITMLEVYPDLFYAPSPTPLVDGGIELVWNLKPNRRFMLTIPKSGMHIRYLYSRGTYPDTYQAETGSDLNLPALVSLAGRIRGQS